MPVQNPSAAATVTLRSTVPPSRTSPGSGRKQLPRRAGRRTLVWWAEVAVVLGVYIAYDTTRGLHRGGIGTADRNGRRVYAWEHDLALSPEHWLNQSLYHLPALEVVCSYYYATLHFIVTPVVLIWMYRAHPEHYRHARTWLGAATVIALLGYWLFPVAPPRLLPGSGIHDILADVHQWGWWSAHSAAPNGLGSLVNEYAAMPSLHVGWALWSGWLVARHARRRVVRALGVAYPVATSLVVMGTGNHYLFDVLAGAGLMAVVGAVTAVLMRIRPIRGSRPIRVRPTSGTATCVHPKSRGRSVPARTAARPNASAASSQRT